MATNIGVGNFTASTSDEYYYYWQGSGPDAYSVDLALQPYNDIFTYVAYVPMTAEIAGGNTFQLNADIAYAATGPNADMISFPQVTTDDISPDANYTITVLTGPGDDIFSEVTYDPDKDSTITLVAYGGSGSDVIRGGRENDTLFGDSFNTIDFSTASYKDITLAMDTPDTYAGDDRLFGFRGSDTIDGGAGNDVIDAGPRGYGDKDIVTGGAGADNFLLSYASPETGAGTDFWSVWGQNLTNDEVGQVVGSVVSGLVEDGAEIADGFALGGLGQLLGASVESFIDFLIAMSASGTPSGTEDILVVTDFDPSEDVIFVPRPKSVTLNDTVEYFTGDNGQTGWGIQFADNGNNIYAQVMLSTTFLQSLGISSENSTASASILESVLSRSSTISGTGGLDTLTSANVLAQLPGKGYVAPSKTDIVPSDTQLAVWGALGPIVADGSVAGTSDEGSVTFGTIYSDALTSNPKFVDPETFTLNDSLQDKAALINGYAGDDLIFGTTQSDTLIGGTGDDVIYTFLASFDDGELVQETVNAGGGYDTVYTGASGGTYSGGKGDADTLIFFYGNQIEASRTPAEAYQVVMDLTLPTPLILDAAPAIIGDVAPTAIPFTTAVNSYTVTGFETFIGGPLNDWIRGASGLVIGGGAGPDYLDVGAGNVGLTYETSTEGVNVVLQEGLLKLQGGDATGDVLDNLQTGSDYNVSSLTGSNEDDELYMVAASTEMRGLDGTDTFGLYWDPNNAISFVQICDFQQDEVIDLRAIGVTSFDQIQAPAPFEFEYISPDQTQTLRVLLQGYDGLALTASNFLFATAAEGSAVGTIGDDGLAGGAGRDRFAGLMGDDVLLGNRGRDVLFGQDGSDYLVGGAGNDRLFGGRDGDRLEGGTGNDVARGNGGDDHILLGLGTDVGIGAIGDDTLMGGAGSDLLKGGRGDDRLGGGLARDVLQGGRGEDLLFGSKGNDLLFGGWNNDRLAGGAGADRMWGGRGADTFVLRFDHADGDRIGDFNRDEADRILLSHDKSLTVTETSAGMFDVTDGQTTASFVAQGATLDDIFLLQV